MWHYLGGFLNQIMVAEFPKSGGTWFCSMLADLTSLSFPRNISPPFSRCILQSHLSYHNRLKNPILLVRDGRDVMVSAYHHFLHQNDRNSNRLVEIWRNRMPFKEFENVRRNLPAFIKVFHHEFKAGGRHQNWSSFHSSYFSAPDIHLVKYEDLLTDGPFMMREAVEFLGFPRPSIDHCKQTCERFSFQTQANRNAGEERSGSFLRKGISGDWKNNFSPEACSVFNHYYGNTLIQLGYERDHKWF